MNFDDILEELGEMGKFQIVTYLLICLPIFFCGAHTFTYVFTAGIPHYRCFVPGCDTDINPSYNASWLRYAIPKKTYGTVGDEYIPAQCEIYLPLRNSVVGTNGSCAPEMFSRKTTTCDRWVFDEYDRTIVTDWNIVCLDNQWKLSLIGTVHFAGSICGTAIFGFLADKYGRKKIFLLCIMLMALTGTLQAIAPEYITFTILIYLNAFVTTAVYPMAFVLGVELVGRKKREAASIILNYFYALGEASVALLQWAAGDWVWTQLIASVPCFFFIVYYWYIPESVRWLIVNNKTEEAKKTVLKAARVNKVILSEKLLSTFDEEESENKKEDDEKPIPVYKFISQNRKMIVRFSIILFIWISVAFVYYGLSLNATSMSGNKYLNLALICLIEIPGYTISWFCMTHFGRKKPLIFSFILCGFTCMATTVVPHGITWAGITLSCIGKLGVTAAFGVIFVYSAELLPTPIRSGGVGTASTMGRFGPLLAPFVPLLGIYVEPLPMILFGCISLFAGILALKLPETKGIKLPETVREANQI